MGGGVSGTLMYYFIEPLRCGRPCPLQVLGWWCHDDIIAYGNGEGIPYAIIYCMN